MSMNIQKPFQESIKHIYPCTVPQKNVYFRSLRQNSESVQVNSCWEMGEVRIFLFFSGQCIAHVNSVLLSYLILVTNIPLLDLIDSTFL